MLRRPGRRSSSAALSALVGALALLGAAADPGASLPAASYRDEVVADAPAGYWRLGESTGTTGADQSANGNLATYRNGFTLGRAGALLDDADTAVGLDGSSAVVRIASSGTLNPTVALSFEAWVKPAALPSGTATLARKDLQYLVRLSADGAITFRLWKAGAAREATTPSGLVGVGAWHHVAATWDGATMAVYVDGVARATQSLTGPIDTGTSSLYLGASSGYDYLDGTLDEAAVYASALPAARVQAHYVRGALDTTPPLVSLLAPADGGALARSDPLLSGAGATGPRDATTVTAKVYAGGAASGPPVQTLSAPLVGGAWSVRAAPLADGAYTARAEQGDTAGNTGLSSSSTFTIDTTAPILSLAVPPAGGVATDRAPELRGLAGTAAGDGAIVTVRLYAGASATGAPAQTLSAPVADGTWSIRPAPLADGEHTVTAAQSDLAGNIATTAARTFTVDAPGPAISLSSPADGNTTREQGPLVAGTAGTAPGDETTVTVRLYAGRSVSAGPSQTLTAPVVAGAWAVRAGPLADGDHTAQAEQRDASGTVATSAAHTFTVDRTAPVVTVTSPGTGSATTSPAPTLQGDAGALPGDGADVTVRLYAGSSAAGTPLFTRSVPVAAGRWSTVPDPLADGGYTVEVEQADALGNAGRATSTFTVDRVAPTVTVTAPSADATVVAAPALGGAAGSAPGDGATVSVKIFAGATATGTPEQTLSAAATGGTWSASVSVPLAAGTHTVQATQADAAGNTGTSEARSFVVDDVAPAVTLLAPAPGAVTTERAPTFSGSAGIAAGDAGSVRVRLYAGTGAAGAPLQTLWGKANGGSWSARASAFLADGTYTARADQADGAGNGGLSAAVTFTVVAPPAPTASYSATVLADAPRAYWRLGEASGTTAANVVAGAPSGSYRGGITLGQPGAVGGDPNTAVTLDGATGRVRMASASALNPTTALTLEAWVRPAALPARDSTVLRKSGQYQLRVTSAGAVSFRLWQGAAVATLTSPGAVVGTGRWTQLAATWDGATMTVYADGVVRATKSLSGAISAGTASLYVGAAGDSSEFLSGRLDEVAVYGRALSAARVLAHRGAATGADTTAPTVALLTPAAGSTMDARPTFGGTGGTVVGDGAAVTVRIHQGIGTFGSPLQMLSAQTHGRSGVYSVTAAAPLPDGTYTAVAEQRDAAGNLGLSATSTFAVQATADPVVLAAGDIAGCDTPGDEATAAVLDRSPGTVISLGDTVYESGTTDEFTDCYDPSWGRQRARTRPVVGDHEYAVGGAGGYFGYFGAAAGDPARGYYSYDLGSWHVVTLNATCDALPGGCAAGSAQEQWLRADLAASAASCTLVLLHTPRFSSGAVHGSNSAYQSLWQALHDHGVEVVLGGNDHVYERFAPQTPAGVLDSTGGVRQFTVGTGGRSHYAFATPLPTSEVRDSDTFGLLRLTLRPTGYDWRFLPEAGKAFADAGSDACH